MFQFVLCLFGLHSTIEFECTADSEEIKLCRDCLKEIK
ncbi:hypothetical protein F899_01585 [Acinetobacter sp. CIP 101934]|jgi:hypothetical protein|uniref:Uncharacterized protein n=2 Tax=Acinetobacter schindleri TaxID=108981 RepID=N9AI78_9GAMM|nr:hypothetical protein F965_02313 [Acinetobacter schindleri NIPH 900]ENV43385.1 hypothetical protein F955_02469 [Acinetobacter schindleri CIP 107287]ENX00952.1 hypothetical protein F899_01585 [Acinetobacter sp. CIP 101934]MBB4836913.1 hypothetical protein [Acinetobacter schindleri]